jgi:hypothetical protein
LGLREGLIEAFANVYRDFAVAVRARFTDPAAALSDSVPGIDEGGAPLGICGASREQQPRACRMGVLDWRGGGSKDRGALISTVHPALLLDRDETVGTRLESFYKGGKAV